LELGGGQCWGACVVKRLYPGKRVTGSDIAEPAVRSAGKWESIFGVKLDEVRVARSYATGFSDESFDLIFAFQSAHHFRNHMGTLTEIKRILRPGGVALYLNEPGCPGYLYPFALRRVNAKRPAVPEDLIINRLLVSAAERIGLRSSVRPDPHLDGRGVKEMLYYYVLSKVRPLQKALPCTVDFIFEKPFSD
jgi:SAM-dependent methyltransferase